MKILIGVCAVVAIIGVAAFAITAGSHNNNNGGSSDEWNDRVIQSIRGEGYSSSSITNLQNHTSAYGDSAVCTGTVYIDGSPYSFGFTYSKNGSTWLQTSGYVNKAS